MSARGTGLRVALSRHLHRAPSALTLEPECRWPRELGALWGARRPPFSQGSAIWAWRFLRGEALAQEVTSGAGAGRFRRSASSGVRFGDSCLSGSCSSQLSKSLARRFSSLAFILCAVYSDVATSHAVFEVVSWPEKARALGSAGACLFTAGSSSTSFSCRVSVEEAPLSGGS